MLSAREEKERERREWRRNKRRRQCMNIECSHRTERRLCTFKSHVTPLKSIIKADNWTLSAAVVPVRIRFHGVELREN